MKASDLNLSNSLEFQHNNAEILFNKRRILVFDAESMGRMRREVIWTMGEERARGMLVRFGYSCGYLDAIRLRDLYVWDTDQDWLDAGIVIQSLKGIVKSVKGATKVDRTTGEFKYEVFFENSYEAEEDVKLFGPQKQPRCWSMLGYASGYASAFFGREIYFVEDQCVANGHKRCHLLGQPLEVWPEKEKEFFRCFQEENIGTELTEVYDQLKNEKNKFQKLFEDLVESQKKEADLKAQLVLSERLSAIGQLASGVGHELRNPLSTIRNVMYYLRETYKDSLLKEDPTLKEFVDVAETEIQSATNIVSDLLDFSRVLKLETAPTNLSSLLKEVRSVVAIPPEVKIIETLASLPPTILDPQRMRQVFINMIMNAVQAMPTGGELEILTRLEAEGTDLNPWVLIEFRDSGEGIDPTNTKKIFEPLFTTKAKGTGLGLPICQGIVEKHGGRILVSSVPSKGSTFTVRLPLNGVSNGK